MEQTLNEPELWARVNASKQRVFNAIGATTHLPHTFRSTQTYQAYTSLCGEAQMAHADGELTEELVKLLDEQADKVIALWQTKAA